VRYFKYKKKNKKKLTYEHLLTAEVVGLLHISSRPLSVKRVSERLDENGGREPFQIMPIIKSLSVHISSKCVGQNLKMKKNINQLGDNINFLICICHSIVVNFFLKTAPYAICVSFCLICCLFKRKFCSCYGCRLKDAFRLTQSYLNHARFLGVLRKMSLLFSENN